jgi:hypothetical protein
MKKLNWFQKALIKWISQHGCEYKKIMKNGRCWVCGKELTYPPEYQGKNMENEADNKW